MITISQSLKVMHINYTDILKAISELLILTTTLQLPFSNNQLI